MPLRDVSEFVLQSHLLRLLVLALPLKLLYLLPEVGYRGLLRLGSGFQRLQLFPHILKVPLLLTNLNLEIFELLLLTCFDRRYSLIMLFNFGF